MREIRNENARDLDWQIVEPLIRIRHDASYFYPGSDRGTHVAGIPKPVGHIVKNGKKACKNNG
jgi:hypothetical protein